MTTGKIPGQAGVPNRSKSERRHFQQDFVHAVKPP